MGESTHRNESKNTRRQPLLRTYRYAQLAENSDMVLPSKYTYRCCRVFKKSVQ